MLPHLFNGPTGQHSTSRISSIAPSYTRDRIPGLSPTQLTRGWTMVPLPCLCLPPPGSILTLGLGQGSLTPQPLQMCWELGLKGDKVQRPQPTGCHSEQGSAGAHLCPLGKPRPRNGLTHRPQAGVQSLSDAVEDLDRHQVTRESISRAPGPASCFQDAGLTLQPQFTRRGLMGLL